MGRYVELKHCIVDYGSGEILLVDAYINSLDQYCISITFKNGSPLEIPYGKEIMDSVKRNKDYNLLKELLHTID